MSPQIIYYEIENNEISCHYAVFVFFVKFSNENVCIVI